MRESSETQERQAATRRPSLRHNRDSRMYSVAAGTARVLTGGVMTLGAGLVTALVGLADGASETVVNVMAEAQYRSMQRAQRRRGLVLGEDGSG